MTNWLIGVILGVVQGISEWLPISSKTQIIIASTFLFPGLLSFSQAYAFGLFLEAGTFFAALFYFRSEVWRVLKALVGRGDEEGRLLLKYLVIVTLITAVLGVAIYKVVSETVSGPVLGVPMLALGCILIGDGILIKLAKGRFVPRKGLKELSLRDLVIIGLAQGVAALPGVSRSGATVSAMLLLGVKPEDSFRLSFIALIPASVGATAVTVLLSTTQISSVVSIVSPQAIAIAILVTVLIGVGFIRILLKAAGSSKIALLTFSLGVLAVFSGATTLLLGVA
ncbi:MAG TPA: undecaprenyl-diphosphate phosphatase [Nitrososphaerales archaeon]|nr:undecaprenyl-diphosphate phosphatase [Nitrososphaerales archaeon]